MLIFPFWIVGMYLNEDDDDNRDIHLNTKKEDIHHDCHTGIYIWGISNKKDYFGIF